MITQNSRFLSDFYKLDYMNIIILEEWANSLKRLGHSTVHLVRDKTQLVTVMLVKEILKAEQLM